MKIIPITDRTENQFRETCPNYSNKFMILNLWLEEKKRTLPCFNAFGFDEQGRLYEKDYLGDREWHFVKPDITTKENED